MICCLSELARCYLSVFRGKVPVKYEQGDVPVHLIIMVKSKYIECHYREE